MTVVFLCLQKLKGARLSLLVLALFRQITYRYKSANINLRPSPQVPTPDVCCDWSLSWFLSLSHRFLLYVNLQETAILENFLKNIGSKELRDFCCELLSNRIGGAGLSLSVNMNAQRQTVLELLVHLDALLLAGSPLLVPLRQIAFQPQNVNVRHHSFHQSCHSCFAYVPCYLKVALA